jgi:hypothetical protein
MKNKGLPQGQKMPAYRRGRYFSNAFFGLMIFYKYYSATKLIIAVAFIFALSACQFLHKSNSPPNMSKTRPTPLNKNNLMHMEEKQKNIHL